MKTTIELLDEGFDSLSFTEVQPSQPRPPAVPHCDCQEANERFFNEPLASAKDGDSWCYTMVPTEAHRGLCVYCGYHTLLQPVGPMKRALTNRKNSKKAASRHAPVVGRCVETGGEVTYPTAKAAYLAGHGSVQWAIANQRPVKGREWRRA